MVQARLSAALLVVLFCVTLPVHCGIYKMLAEAMLNHVAGGWNGGWNSGWESKGVTLGIKSKGMTAIIPVPLPVPIFTKDKGGGGGGGGSSGGNGGGEKIKYIPIPVPQHGKEDWW